MFSTQIVLFAPVQSSVAKFAYMLKTCVSTVIAFQDLFIFATLFCKQPCHKICSHARTLTVEGFHTLSNSVGLFKKMIFVAYATYGDYGFFGHKTPSRAVRTFDLLRPV